MYESNQNQIKFCWSHIFSRCYCGCSEMLEGTVVEQDWSAGTVLKDPSELRLDGGRSSRGTQMHWLCRGDKMGMSDLMRSSGCV